MKKAKLILVVNVPDDFEEGKCKDCPLCVKSYYAQHQYVEENLRCKIECSPFNCPIVVNKGR